MTHLSFGLARYQKRLEGALMKKKVEIAAMRRDMPERKGGKERAKDREADKVVRRMSMPKKVK
jgi:hypothetical protein